MADFAIIFTTFWNVDRFSYHLQHLLSRGTGGELEVHDIQDRIQNAGVRVSGVPTASSNPP
eukprot:6257213-Karenia_brevis.AAC.1